MMGVVCMYVCMYVSKMFVSVCTNRKSNPGQMLGRHLCYHYTIGAYMSPSKLILLCKTTNTHTKPEQLIQQISHT